MSDRTPTEQLTKYLTDVHAIEVQAIAQMKAAPDLANDPDLGAIYRGHLTESEDHERLVAEQLDRLGAKPSTLKDAAGRAGGWGMVLFARLNPDTPGKLAAHSYSYEHMELAAHELLARIAQRLGDEQVAAMAQRIAREERAMAQRIAERFDTAVDVSLHAKGADDLRDEVVKYLRDAHALEGQAIQLLEAGPAIAGLEPLAEAFERHLAETREHQRMVDGRLRELDSGPSRFQAGALRLGAMNLGGFFKAQPDTPTKLAGFAYAFEALECAAYELLRRTARRADDEETAAMAERILEQERLAAEQVAATWDAAADAALAEHGVAH
jgi:ferritin-like metal-binding protein YciE